MRRRRELMRQPAASAHRTPRPARNCLHGRPDLLRHKKTACVRSHGNQSARRAPSASPACSDAPPRRRVTCARRRRRAIRSCVPSPACGGRGRRRAARHVRFFSFRDVRRFIILPDHAYPPTSGRALAERVGDGTVKVPIAQIS